MEIYTHIGYTESQSGGLDVYTKTRTIRFNAIQPLRKERSAITSHLSRTMAQLRRPDVPLQCKKMLHTAFDLGITHFDLANNYGPPPGSAELNFGKLLAQDFPSHRDELIISSKAGYLMWPESLRGVGEQEISPQ